MYEEIEITDGKDWRELEPSFTVKVLLTVIYSLILVIGIVGNSVTIRVTQLLRCNGYLQKNVTDHMVSLACSDLLVLLIGMPVEVYSATWFPFTSASGNASCKIYSFLFEACSYATILNVATLSFERYVAICHPFRFKDLSGKRTSTLIAFAWLVSVVVALPLLVATGTQSHMLLREKAPIQNLTFCTNLKEHWVMYRVSIFVAFIIYMLVLICVAFMCRAMILVLRGTMGSMDKEVNGVQRAPKHESSKVKAARKQTIIFLGVIVATLMVCWLPMQIRRLMMAAANKSAWTTPYFRTYITLHPVSDVFFYLSSVLNPFLYNLSSRQFRQVFLQVLRCRLTLEHVNKRTLPRSRVASARSLRPLLLKSLRRSRMTRSTQEEEEEKIPPSFKTFLNQSDSGVASDTQQSLTVSAESDSALKSNTNAPAESDI
ncbi:G-protein coupled receptor 39 [Genypterus blacodes]|uniref:G-protein coupled receptor 39 n=1 Tax=Genypterus blacodes TaxID=154954 RepID=UPI003F7652A0